MKSSTESGAAPAPTLALRDAAATARLGAALLTPLAELAERQASGALLALDGPLGAGKSALARALIRAAGHAGPVPSPTFTLVEPYSAPALAIFHLDLYRLGESDELALLGFAEMRVQGVLTIVEWAGRVAGVAAAADIAVAMAYAGADAGAGRVATLTARPTLAGTLAALAHQFK